MSKFKGVFIEIEKIISENSITDKYFIKAAYSRNVKNLLYYN